MINNQPTTAYIGGTFDLLHPGHIDLFRKAGRIADRVVVSLNTDEFIEQYKGKPPVMTLAERTDMVRACKYVYDVVCNIGGADSKPAILLVKPQFIIHGDDWVGDAYFKQLGVTQEWLDEHKIDIVYVPYYRGVSSTDIKKRLWDRKE